MLLNPCAISLLSYCTSITRGTILHAVDVYVLTEYIPYYCCGTCSFTLFRAHSSTPDQVDDDLTPRWFPKPREPTLLYLYYIYDSQVILALDKLLLIIRCSSTTEYTIMSIIPFPSQNSIPTRLWTRSRYLAGVITSLTDLEKHPGSPYHTGRVAP